MKINNKLKAESIYELVNENFKVALPFADSIDNKSIIQFRKNNFSKKTYIHFQYSHEDDRKIYRYFCYNLPGCVIEENDPEEAYNKFLWGILECLDCRYEMMMIDKNYYLTGNVQCLKDYRSDIFNEKTIPVTELELELHSEGYNLIYEGTTVNIFWKKGLYSTICVPNKRIKPIMPLNQYYGLIRFTNEISRKHFNDLYGYL